MLFPNSLDFSDFLIFLSEIINVLINLINHFSNYDYQIITLYITIIHSESSYNLFLISENDLLTTSKYYNLPTILLTTVLSTLLITCHTCFVYPSKDFYED